MKNILFLSALFMSLFLFSQEEKLRFNDNGEFKILQFSDTHHNSKSKSSYKTFETITTVVEKENPDLIVITGDIITADPAEEGWNQLAKVLSDTKTPWTVTFGNHDEEHNLSKEEIYHLLRKKPFFVGEIGNSSGVLNFSQPILGSKSNNVMAVLYFVDSHDYVRNPVLGSYDWIKHDQIEWYQKESDTYTYHNQNIPVPSLMFFHIPLIEFKHVDRDKNKVGEKKEGVASSEVNSGLFSAILAQKDVIGVFTGHDHNNNYIGIYKNIALGFGNLTGADAYGSLERGGRVIVLKENKFSFFSYITTPTKVDFPFYYPAGLSEIDETTHVLSAQKVIPKNKGLRYKYYQGNVQAVEEINKLKPIKEGAVSKFNIDEALQEDHFAFQFDGYFYAPETAFYKFYIYSDDGAVLSIDNQVIVDNDGGHSPRRKEDKVALEKGYHKIKLDYFEDYMGQVLEVGFSSISIPEQELNENYLYH